VADFVSSQEQIQQYERESIEEDISAVFMFLSYNANNLRSSIESFTGISFTTNYHI